MSGTDKDLGVTTASSDLCVHPDADMMTTVTVTVTQLRAPSCSSLWFPQIPCVSVSCPDKFSRSWKIKAESFQASEGKTLRFLFDTESLRLFFCFESFLSGTIGSEMMCFLFYFIFFFFIKPPSCSLLFLVSDMFL